MLVKQSVAVLSLLALLHTFSQLKVRVAAAGETDRAATSASRARMGARSNLRCGFFACRGGHWSPAFFFFFSKAGAILGAGRDASGGVGA